MVIGDDSDEIQNAVELNTFIRNQRESLARYDNRSHSDDSYGSMPVNRDDDEKLMRNMQFIFNQDKRKEERKPTMVDIELDADAPQEDEIEFDKCGSLDSDKSSQTSNPYMQPE